MTYRPEFEVGPRSPGVWKEVRRLEGLVETLEDLLYRATAPTASALEEEDRSRAIAESRRLLGYD